MVLPIFVQLIFHMQQSAQEVLKDIKQKKLAPIYLLHGDEPYLIDQLVDAFEKEVLPEDQQSFNQFVLLEKIIV